MLLFGRWLATPMGDSDVTGWRCNGGFWNCPGTVSMADIVKDIGRRQVYDIVQGRKPRAAGVGVRVVGANARTSR